MNKKGGARAPPPKVSVSQETEAAPLEAEVQVVEAQIHGEPEKSAGRREKRSSSETFFSDSQEFIPPTLPDETRGKPEKATRRSYADATLRGAGELTPEEYSLPCAQRQRNRSRSRSGQRSRPSSRSSYSETRRDGNNLEIEGIEMDTSWEESQSLLAVKRKEISPQHQGEQKKRLSRVPAGTTRPGQNVQP